MVTGLTWHARNGTVCVFGLADWLGPEPNEARPSFALGEATQKRPCRSGRERNVLYKPENIYPLETNVDKDLWKKSDKPWKCNISALVPELPMEIPSDTTNKFPEHVNNLIIEEGVP